MELTNDTWDDSTRQSYGMEGDQTEKYKLELFSWEQMYLTRGPGILPTAYSDLD